MANNPPQMNYCSECGIQLMPDAKFCSSCGSKVIVVNVSKTVYCIDCGVENSTNNSNCTNCLSLISAQLLPSAELAHATPNSTQGSTNQSNSSGSLLIAGIAVVALAFGIFAMVTANKSSENSDTTITDTTTNSTTTNESNSGTNQGAENHNTWAMYNVCVQQSMSMNGGNQTNAWMDCMYLRPGS